MTSGTPPDTWRVRWAHSFAIDFRSMAAFRIAIGTVILWDVVTRAVDLRAHYTDSGVLPREIARASGSEWFSLFSLSYLSGSAWFQSSVLILLGVAAGCLIAGWRTRAASIVCWFVVLSVHARNPLILSRADLLLRTLLFWSMFLPLGARWSFDAKRRGAVPKGEYIALGGAATLIQIALVYWFSGLLKTSDIWWSGEAVGYVLQLDQMTTALAPALARITWLHPPLTWATLTVELAGPFLPFLPFHRQRFRIAAVALFISLHVGFASAIHLGIFVPVCIAAWLLFLPPLAWQRLRPGRVFKAVQVPSPRPGAPSEAAAALALTAILVWNIFTLRSAHWPSREWLSERLPAVYAAPMEAFGLAQLWSMFAPAPNPDDGWFIAPARLADGRVIDLLTGEVPRYGKPASAREMFGTERWRKFMMYLIRDEHAWLRRIYAAYLRDEWLRRNPQVPPIEMSIEFMHEPITSDRESVPAERRRLYHYTEGKEETILLLGIDTFAFKKRAGAVVAEDRSTLHAS